jgi:hypothetical protein
MNAASFAEMFVGSTTNGVSNSVITAGGVPVVSPSLVESISSNLTVSPLTALYKAFKFVTKSYTTTGTSGVASSPLDSLGSQAASVALKSKPDVAAPASGGILPAYETSLDYQDSLSTATWNLYGELKYQNVVMPQLYTDLMGANPDVFGLFDYLVSQTNAFIDVQNTLVDINNSMIAYNKSYENQMEATRLVTITNTQHTTDSLDEIGNKSLRVAQMQIESSEKIALAKLDESKRQFDANFSLRKSLIDATSRQAEFIHYNGNLGEKQMAAQLAVLDSLSSSLSSVSSSSQSVAESAASQSQSQSAMAPALQSLAAREPAPAPVDLTAPLAKISTGLETMTAKMPDPVKIEATNTKLAESLDYAKTPKKVVDADLTSDSFAPRDSVFLSNAAQIESCVFLKTPQAVLDADLSKNTFAPRDAALFSNATTIESGVFQKAPTEHVFSDLEKLTMSPREASATASAQTGKKNKDKNGEKAEDGDLLGLLGAGIAGIIGMNGIHKDLTKIGETGDTPDQALFGIEIHQMLGVLS